MKNQDYNKIRTAIRYWMLGKNYTVAHTSMEFAMQYHTGLRKDGITPEFQHQVSQANFARTLDKVLMFPQESLATVFLHDVVEDCPVTLKDVERMLVDEARATDKQIGLILTGVEKMTNQVDGVKKPLESYYGEMSDDPISSIGKGFDRIHNHQSMGGVFTMDKQSLYIGETEQYIIPMLKRARKRWVEQEAAYQNVKHVLLTQMELVTQLVQSSQAT